MSIHPPANPAAAPSSARHLTRLRPLLGAVASAGRQQHASPDRTKLCCQVPRCAPPAAAPVATGRARPRSFPPALLLPFTLRRCPAAALLRPWPPRRSPPRPQATAPWSSCPPASRWKACHLRQCRTATASTAWTASPLLARRRLVQPRPGAARVGVAAQALSAPPPRPWGPRLGGGRPHLGGPRARTKPEWLQTSHSPMQPAPAVWHLLRIKAPHPQREAYLPMSWSEVGAQGLRSLCARLPPQRLCLGALIRGGSSAWSSNTSTDSWSCAAASSAAPAVGAAPAPPSAPARLVAALPTAKAPAARRGVGSWRRRSTRSTCGSASQSTQGMRGRRFMPARISSSRSWTG